MYKWFLATRYLHTKLIAVFGIISVSLCVAMVLVVISVMGGFLDNLRERSRGLLADIILDVGTMQGWPYYEEFATHLRERMPETVETTTPVIYSYGLLRVPSLSATKPVQVFGIKLDEYTRVNDFANSLYYQRYWPGTTNLGPQRMPVAARTEAGAYLLPPDLEEASQRWRQGASETDIRKFDAQPFVPAPYAGERVYEAWYGEPGYTGEEYPGIIIGSDVLNRREDDGTFTRPYPRGADMTLTLLPLTQTGNLTGEPPIAVPVRYADDSHTGVYEIDQVNVYVDFDMLQQRLAMDPQERIDGGFTRPRTVQLLVTLRDGVDVNDARDAIEAEWISFRNSVSSAATDEELDLMAWVDVLTWEDMQRPFIAAVEKEKILMTILFAIMCMVAIVLIGLIFYMIVEKKTRDIGIIKSLGASSAGVAGLFFVYAAAVGVVGSLVGAALGASFTWYINDIQDWLARLNPQLRVWDPSVYTFSTIPNVVKLRDVLWISASAVLASLVGALIPAFIAGRVWPVGALRYE